MLSLDLMPGDRVAIGDNVTLTLEEKTGRRARISVQAPREMHIRKLPAPSAVIEAARKGITRN